MNFLLDPNIAYLILLAGIFLTFLAIATPGTGLLELSAVFCFVLAGYAAYNLEIHWWALLILTLSLPPFIFALRSPGRGIFLGLSIFLLIVGSVFLFAGDGQIISVNPLVALVGSVLVALPLWYMIRKSIEIMSSRPQHDLGGLIGLIGEAKSAVYKDGSVYVNGEMWSARSDSEIPSGSLVRIVSRDGFVLVVEKK